MGLLTASDVLSALTVCCGEEPESPGEAVALVRQSEPSLAATLYSAWLAEGEPLDTGLRHDLDVARARIAFYREVSGQLTGQVPDLLAVKGLEVADLYPAGLTRSMNDLDFTAESEPDLWRAVAVLVDGGWDLHTATFVYFDRTLHVMVSVRRPPEHRYRMPVGVEITSYVSLGDMGGMAPVARLPRQWQARPVKNMIMLLYERFEQRFRARDLVDASLQLNSAPPDELVALDEAIHRLGLEPEYAELAALVARTTLEPLPLASPHAATIRATRARRLARKAAMLRRPVHGLAQNLQRRHISGRLTRPERQVWQAMPPRLSPATAVRAGLLAFGLPLEGALPTAGAVTMWQRGRLTWVDTPAGRFLLTIGDDVTQADVSELSTPDPVAGARVVDLGPGTGEPVEPALRATTTGSTR